jgi:hypothetical protein
MINCPLGEESCLGHLPAHEAAAVKRGKIEGKSNEML